MIEDFGVQNIKPWRRYGYFVIGAVALISLALIINGSIGGKNDTSNSPNLVESIVVPNIVRADPKKVAEGFPETLILNSKIDIIGSYLATYPNSSAKQTTVEFISSKNPDTNYDFYIKWATDNKWGVINSSKSDLIISLYFKKSSEAINITIRPYIKVRNGSNIVISYVNLNR